MKILESLKSVFGINGVDIHWMNWENRRIVGHTGRPEKGDVFTSKMKSGKVAVFEVIKVDWCNDPRNMYFCDVKDVGYWVAE